MFNRQGERLGQIRDLMIEKRTGAVAYAVLAFGGVLGVGEKYVPAPWSALEYDVGLDGYVLPLDKERLRTAPGYTLDELSEGEPAWREQVHLFWG